MAKKNASKASAKPARKTVLKTAKRSAKKVATPETGVAYKLRVGDRAPKFKALATSGKTVNLADFIGKKLVLYFYPKDSTPGCTLEGYDFKKLYSAFKKAGAEVVGVSRDSLRSHENFREKCGFPFELLSDEDGTLCKAFDVIQMKNNYGRTYEGIERSTFVIDAEGRVAKEWRKVKVAGHGEDVLKAVKEI